MEQFEWNIGTMWPCVTVSTEQQICVRPRVSNTTEEDELSSCHCHDWDFFILFLTTFILIK